MRKMSTGRKRRIPHDTMRKEYRFDYRRAKPNRFAEKMSKEVVAAVFNSSEAVNALLRSVIAAMPEPKQQPG